jgi:hypothetical protein
MAVFRTCVPKARLLGVADKLGEPLTGVGLGAGVGVGEPLAVCVPPPQPITLTVRMVKTRKRPTCMAGFVLLRTVTPHSGNFIRDCCLRRDVSCYHFITSTFAPQDTEVPKRESFGHAPAHVQVTDFHDIAEDQRKLSCFLICVAKKPKFPEEKICEGTAQLVRSFARMWPE